MPQLDPTAQQRPGRRRREPLPAVDERIVMPEARFEILDGELTYVSPADEAHGSRHSKISAILEAHAAGGYDVAVDMLTRTSTRGDMAPDASVFPSERDPETGGRRLEELAFEVVSTEKLGHAARKARALASRGVRRIFAVDVERRRALEWSAATDTWELLPNDAVIEDRALAVRLPLRALVDTAKADDAVAAALLAKGNPVLEEAVACKREEGKREGRLEGKQEGRLEGKLEGKIESLLAFLAARGLSVTGKAAKKIRAVRDEATLDLWLRRAATAGSTEELFRK